VLFILALFTEIGYAACADQTTDLNNYVNCRLKELAVNPNGDKKVEAAGVDETIKARLNQNGEKQTEAPAVSSASSSLVDKSSPADLVAVALNLAGLTTKSTTPNSTNSSATVTAYAFLAAANRKDPLEPVFYNANRNWRKVAFTLGQEFPDQSGATTDRANLYGVKVMVLDRRDLADPANNDLYDQVRTQLDRVGGATGAVVRELRNLVRSWGLDPDNTDFSKLSPDQLQQLDDKIQTASGPASQMLKTLSEFEGTIRKRPQFSIALQSRVSKETAGVNRYRLEAIYDKGILKNFSFDTNASFEYSDSPLTGEDKRGGRVSHQFEYHAKNGRSPVVVSFAGDGSWMTKSSPIYQAQFKISFTLLPGMEFPLSVTYASSTELIKESEVKGKFGFTFDLAKLVRAFSSF
jgi:hypothetical protein